MKKQVYLAMLTIVAAFATDAQTLTVSKIEGHVFSSIDQHSWKKVKPNAVLQAGTALKTDHESVAVLTVDKNITFRLNPDSIANLATTSSSKQTNFKLDQGDLNVNIPGNNTPVVVAVPFGAVKCGQGTFNILIKPAIPPQKRPAVEVKAITGNALVSYQSGDQTITKEIRGAVLQAPDDQPVEVVAAPLLPENAKAKVDPQENSPYQPLLDKKPEQLNRVDLAYRTGINMTTKFSGIGHLAGSPYFDGYINPDLNKKAGGTTMSWGYNDPNQNDTVNNRVGLDRYTGDGATKNQDFMNQGVDLQYSRQLDHNDSWHWGLEGAVNWTTASTSGNAEYEGKTSQTTDYYNYSTSYTVAPAPSTAPPAPPVNYPGLFPLSNNIAGSAVSATTNQIKNSDSLSMNLVGARVGPYVSRSWGTNHKFELGASGGFALGWLSVNDSWRQSIARQIDQATSTTKATYGNPVLTHGGGTDNAFLPGFYLGLSANFEITHNFGVFGSVQYQNLGTYNHSFDGRNASVDLSNSLYFMLGLSYSF